MRLLIIDNGTKTIAPLQAICSKYDTKTISSVSLASLKLGDIQEFDALILSGSSSHNVAWEADYFQYETDMIRTTNKPVLGICFGFELVCYAFGCRLYELATRVAGATVVTPTNEGAKIFQGTDPIRVHEAHRWAIDEVPRELLIMATSETGIEAVKHRTKPVYGLQFHPENFKYESDGKMVFDNILALFAKQSATH